MFESTTELEKRLTAQQRDLLEKQCEQHFLSTGTDQRKRLVKQLLGLDSYKKPVFKF